MMTRTMLVLMLLLAFLLPACAEETSAPLTDLRAALTAEEAEHFLLYPPEDGLSGVQAGYIRLVSQHKANDPFFREEYWMGGDPDSDLNLNRQKSINSYVYPFHAGNMCTRAVYSMALSYLGVDATPGDMSAMTGLRNLDPPYDEISAMVGVERVQPRSNLFDNMVNNYLSDSSYSPVYVHIRKPNGTDHALLVIAKLPEPSRYLVLDPSGMWLHGQQVRIYTMVFNFSREEVINSTFREEYAGSQVMQVFQWRLLPEEESAENP